MNGVDRGSGLTGLPSLREEGEGCEGEGCEAVESEGGDDLDELNIEGALTDELKILQDRNDGLHQQIEVEREKERERDRYRNRDRERDGRETFNFSSFFCPQDLEVQLSHLSQEKATLEAQLKEVTQVMCVWVGVWVCAINTYLHLTKHMQYMYIHGRFKFKLVCFNSSFLGRRMRRHRQENKSTLRRSQR